MNKKHSYTFLIISILIFILACSQKTYCTDGNCGDNWSGLAVLFSGILGFFLCGACLCWLANPIILISWLTYQWPKLSFITNAIALIIGISFFTFDEIIVNEAGHSGKITGYQTGFYFWILSFLVLMIGNIINLKKQNKSN